MTLRRSLLVAAAAAAVLAPSARADGGPSPGAYHGPNSIVDERHDLRYATLAAGYQTIVEQIRTRDGTIARIRNVSADWGLPAVTWNLDLGGLSPNGKLLVLGTQPQGGAGLAKLSRFLFLDARTLTYSGGLSLRGDFSFDALSPDAKTLYLVQHTSARDLQRYRVRAYDLDQRTLRPGAIVDRTEPNMSGSPYARAATADGAWVYTLYFGAKEPFVHALDTVHGRAVCIDLEWNRSDGDIWRQRIRLADGGKRLAFVDRVTGKVAKEQLDLGRARAAGGGTSWAAATASGLGLAGAAALLLWSRTRRR